MELWIRSQDKRTLTKINDIRLNEFNLNEIIANYKTTSLGSNEYEKLGTYKTKERALEVLDEIQNILKPQMMLSKVGKPIAETCDGLVYKEPDEYEIKELLTYVYEMPKD